MNKFINGRPLFNSAGDIDLTSTGYQYIIDTLTHINADVTKQKFFEVNVPDYMPIDVGSSAWKSKIVQNREYYTGANFEDGFIDQGNSRVPQASSALDQISMRTQKWFMGTKWDLPEIQEAAALNWDPVAASLKAMKKIWDLGVQKTAFIGSSDMTGLLNNSEVSINTALIAEDIKTMDTTEFQTFIAGLLSAYFANSNYTVYNPDTFVIPAADYLGLGAATSPTFTTISKLQYMKNIFAEMTNNPNFKILPMVYSQSDKNTFAKDRYTLYRNNSETLKLSIPVDFTMPQAYTVDGFHFEQKAYGQFSGVLVNRPREVLYLDKTATT